MTAKPLSCALLSSFTLDRLPDLVNRRLEAAGVDCHWFVAPFNQYPQFILDQNSELFAAAPQVVFLAVAIEDLFHGLPSPWSQTEQRLLEARRRIADFAALAGRLAARLPSSVVFIHDFVPFEPQPLEALASRTSVGLRRLALEANTALASLAGQCPEICLVHLDDVFRTVPHATVSDPRFFYLAKMRFGRGALECLADTYARMIRARLGLRKKCIVLDLDNTMWGGIVGEDGVENLVLGNDGPGKAFQDLQRVLLEYHRTGTLLALCSKNDEPLALRALRDHPGMVLRQDHFAAMRINWQDKASNLAEIAAELKLGLDAFVFLDDSEFERAEIRRLAPAVTVVDLPSDPSHYPGFVAQLPFFDALSVTEDDRRRGQMYVEDRQRRDLEKQAETLEDFLKGLEIKVEVHRVTPMLVPRLAQLTQRTNQFNLTTRRYTESDLLAMLHEQSAHWRLYCLQASDRIGAAGIVGGALVSLEPAKSTGRLDTFLVSCRILGRGIESAFLSAVLSDLQAGGIRSVLAEYIPTDRNGLAKDFLSKHGFAFAENLWRRTVEGGETLCPAWINLKFIE